MLEVHDLTISFASENEETSAVDRLNLSLADGETMAIVGESGSGKSVTALALTRLLPEPPAIYRSGKILLDGEDILRKPKKALRQIRGSKIAYIFQEPSTSLNPVFTIADQVSEAIQLHRPEIKDVRREALYWLNQVGIADSEKRLKDYPFQLSGGMQQRVMIAIALSCRPKILVADEPTTALDVTVQRQILDLFQELKAKFAMSILLITHNFGIIGGIADQVAVMFRGQVVEQGPTNSVLKNPQHPYSKALIDCVPRLGAELPRLKTIDYAKIGARPAS